MDHFFFKLCINFCVKAIWTHFVISFTFRNFQFKKTKVKLPHNYLKKLTFNGTLTPNIVPDHLTVTFFCIITQHKVKNSMHICSKTIRKWFALTLVFCLHLHLSQKATKHNHSWGSWGQSWSVQIFSIILHRQCKKAYREADTMNIEHPFHTGFNFDFFS